jgi:signal transduction histidine kinase
LVRLGEAATIRCMDTSTARRLAHGLWVAIGVLWLAAIVLVITGSPNPGNDIAIAVIAAIPMAVYGSVGALVARSRPDSPIGWLLLWVGLAAAVWMFGLSYAEFGFEPASGIGTLPGAAVAAWIAVVAFPGATPGVLPLFLLFFPDGHLRSRRWRPVLWLTVVGGALMVFGALWVPWDTDPVQLASVFGSGDVPVFLLVGLFTVIAAAFAGVLALTLRYREADPEDRQPLRLLVGVLGSMAAATALALVASVTPGLPDAVWLVFVLAILVDLLGVLVGIPLAAAAAVLTFGLFDVGVVVKKTVVYVALVVLFLLVLGFVAFLLNPVNLGFGGGGSRGEEAVTRIVSVVSIVVVVLVVSFRPIKRLAYRLVYGRRATPYEAMSEFSERLGDAYSTNDVLPRMAAIVREATGASVARVWLHVANELRPLAAAPSDAQIASTLPIVGDDLPSMEGLRVFPVRDRGELLGAMTVEMPPAEPLSKTGEQLVTDLAGQAGLVLRNVRLIEELQESRRRIVAAQDERARKLERDLHDGAQQQLVALSVKLGLVEQIAARDPSKVPQLVAQAKAETLDALDTLRDLARGIYPPLLRDQGLAAALDAQARKAHVSTQLNGDGIDRYPPEVEAAVYFCCLEAMQNIAKYANASSTRIRLARSNGNLTFEVTDDGAGFDPAAAHGSGLTNMRDRLEALGGSLQIRSRPGAGTAISGSVPVEVTA